MIFLFTAVLVTLSICCEDTPGPRQFIKKHLIGCSLMSEGEMVTYHGREYGGRQAGRQAGCWSSSWEYILSASLRVRNRNRWTLDLARAFETSEPTLSDTSCPPPPHILILPKSPPPGKQTRKYMSLCGHCPTATTTNSGSCSPIVVVLYKFVSLTLCFCCSWVFYA